MTLSASWALQSGSIPWELLLRPLCRAMAVCTTVTPARRHHFSVHVMLVDCSSCCDIKPRCYDVSTSSPDDIWVFSLPLLVSPSDKAVTRNSCRGCFSSISPLPSFPFPLFSFLFPQTQLRNLGSVVSFVYREGREGHLQPADMFSRFYIDQTCVGDRGSAANAFVAYFYPGNISGDCRWKTKSEI